MINEGDRQKKKEIDHDADAKCAFQKNKEME